MIGVIGDAFIDRWVFGSIDRIAPEADCMVFRQERTEDHPGGAAHVADYIARMGGQVQGIWGRKGIKTRFVARQQVFRVDCETTTPISANEEARHLAAVTAHKWDALVLSDYNKGMFGGSLAEQIIGYARNNNIPTIVDPKGPWHRYAGCSVITPNEKELGGADPFDLIARHGFGAVIVTRGAEGMKLYWNGNIELIPRHWGVGVSIDATGAGDVVVAEMAVQIAAGKDEMNAAYLANMAAARSTLKWGTK